MAKVTENLLVRGARGNVGKQYVYKKRGDETHIAKMPAIDKNATVTDKQEGVRDLFAAAAAYAKGAISLPDLKKDYAKKAASGKSAYNIAFRDYLKPPKVKSIKTSGYNGTIGSTIVVTAKDDFRVAEVFVSIRTAAGVLVEEGNALLNPIDRNKWTYTAVEANASLAGSLVTATARDLPGNEAVLEVGI
jgi:hypothetical protein